MEDSSQNADTGDVFKTPTKRPGRPKKDVSSNQGSSGGGRKGNAKKARTAKEQISEDHRTQFDNPAKNTRSVDSSRSHTSQKKTITDIHGVPLTPRMGRVLTQSEILNFLRVIIILKREKQDDLLPPSTELMKTAAMFTDISKAKLHELWNVYKISIRL